MGRERERRGCGRDECTIRREAWHSMGDGRSPVLASSAMEWTVSAYITTATLFRLAIPLCLKVNDATSEREAYHSLHCDRPVETSSIVCPVHLIAGMQVRPLAAVPSIHSPLGRRWVRCSAYSKMCKQYSLFPHCVQSFDASGVRGLPCS